MSWATGACACSRPSAAAFTFPGRWPSAHASARPAAPRWRPLWGDDGFVLRFPDTDEPPDPDWFLVESAEAMRPGAAPAWIDGAVCWPLS